MTMAAMTPGERLDLAPLPAAVAGWEEAGGDVVPDVVACCADETDDKD